MAAGLTPKVTTRGFRASDTSPMACRSGLLSNTATQAAQCTWTWRNHSARRLHDPPPGSNVRKESRLRASKLEVASEGMRFNSKLPFWLGVLIGAQSYAGEWKIIRIEPAEKGFFAKRLDFHGIPIKAPDVVVDEALYAAAQRLSMLLGNQPTVLSNLVTAGGGLQLICRGHVTPHS